MTSRMLARARRRPMETFANLTAWSDSLQRDVATADAKANALLGATLTALGVLVAVLSVVGKHLPLMAAAFLAAGVAFLAAAVLVCVLVLRPNLEGRPLYGTFLGARGLSVDDVIAMAERVGGRDCVDAGHRAHTLMVIVERKFRRLRTATTLVVVSVGCLLAALAAAAVPAL